MQRDITERLRNPNAEWVRATMDEGADEIDRLRLALRSIVDYEPETERLGDDFWAEVDACGKCEVWRQRKHPIQSMCEDHVRHSYAVRHRNDQARAYQYVDMKRIAEDALRAAKVSP